MPTLLKIAKKSVLCLLFEQINVFEFTELTQWLTMRLKVYYCCYRSMVECDLSLFVCPQLFVQFKYHLKIMAKNKQSGMFKVARDADIADIERYLTHQQLFYRIEQHPQFKCVFVLEQANGV